MDHEQDGDHLVHLQREGSPDRQKEQPSKRRRISLACSVCRARKSRCDGARPICSSCKVSNCECIYSQPAYSTTVIIEKSYLSTLAERLKTAEENIKALQTHQIRCHRQLRFEDDINEHSDDGDQETIHHPQQEQGETRVRTDDPPDQNGPENDADGMGAMTFSSEEDCGFYGPTSNIAFTRQISRAVAHLSHFDHSPFTIDNADSQGLRYYGAVMNVSQPPSPSGRLLSRQISDKKQQDNVNIYALPPEDKTRELIVEYFGNTGLLFPYVHEPKFWETYEVMKTNSFTKVRRTWLGLLNIIMALTTSISVESGLSAEERIKESYIYYQRAAGLCNPQIMSGASLELVQYLLVSGQYLQSTQKSVETWTIHGLAVKVAFQLGLHSVDASTRFTPLEREIRKRLWYGCILLDRTLSMTFGRPATIPEDYVRIDLPRPFGNGSSMTGTQDQVHQESREFFIATINLYKIMWNIINVEYAGNIGSDNSSNIFETVSRPLQLEQNLIEWERQLPPSLHLFRPFDEIQSPPPSDSSSPSSPRFCVILTLRYLNLRVLLHRPVLVKFLERLDVEHVEDQELKLLQQIGGNSLQQCVRSAKDIIAIVRIIGAKNYQRRKWLGAWWFSLYYTFNAALVIFAALMISQNQVIAANNFPDTQHDLQMVLLDSITALRQLDNQNKLVERCAIYLTQLVEVLEAFGIHFPSLPSKMISSDSEIRTVMNGPSQNLSTQEGQPPENMYGSFSNLISGDLQMGDDLGEFMLGGDVDFLNQLTRTI